MAFAGFTGDSSVWVAVTAFTGEASTSAFFLEARAAGLEVSDFWTGDFLAAADFPRPDNIDYNNDFLLFNSIFYLKEIIRG